MFRKSMDWNILLISYLFYSILFSVDLQAQIDWGDRSGIARGPQNFLTLGIRSGYDFDADVWSAGGQFVFPLGNFKIIPSGDIFFFDNKTDWQINLDVAFNMAMIYGGIGIAYLNRKLKESVREGNNSGFNYFIGLPLPLPLRRFRLLTYIEARWTNVESISLFRLMLGINFILGRSP